MCKLGCLYYISKSRSITSDLVVLFSNISIGNNGIDLLSFNGYWTLSGLLQIGFGAAVVVLGV